MTRVVSVGRSKSLLAAGALGFAFAALALTGCPGTLDESQFPGTASGAAGSGMAAMTGTAGTTGTAGSGSGTAGTTGTAGTMASGTAGMTGSGTPGCDVTPILIGDATPGHCTMGGCHDANGTSANFSMAAADWYKHLVGVKPMGGGSLMSVCSKDPAQMNTPYVIKGNSTGDGLFLQKVKGAACSGGLQMPFGGTPLSADQITCVQQFTTALAAQP